MNAVSNEVQKTEALEVLARVEKDLLEAIARAEEDLWKTRPLRAEGLFDSIWNLQVNLRRVKNNLRALSRKRSDQG